MNEQEINGPAREQSAAEQSRDMNEHEELLKLRKAVEASGEVVFLTDREGVITYVNPAFTGLYGYSAGEVVGKATPRILKSGTMSQQDYEAFWQTLLNKQVIHGELVNKTKDGRLINIEGSANPVLDQAGNVVGFLAIQRNITERKNAQKALALAEKKYRNLAENASDILMLMDLQGKITYVSRSGEKTTGYSREELESRGMGDLLAPDSLQVARERVKAWLGGAKELPPYEVEVKAKDGRLVPFELASSPVMEDGRLKAVQIMARDITERRRQQKAIRESEVKYQTLVEKLQEGIYQADLEGNILFLNDAGAHIFGFDSADEVIGKHRTTEFYSNAADRARVMESIGKTGYWTGEFPVTRRDETAPRAGRVSVSRPSETLREAWPAPKA